MDGKQIEEGCKLQVQFFCKEARREQTGKGFTNLYVKNFPHSDFQESDLYDIFSKYGLIDSVAIMRDENNASRGFGFVSFKDPADA